MLAGARQFAEEYKQRAGRFSAARANLRHPVLFVFLGECNDASAHIKEHARDICPEGVFFAHLYDEARVDAVKAIRAVKTDIQRNEGNLNVKRVNICAVIKAHNEQAGDMIKDAGRLLRDIFTEDFPIVHMTLFMLLSESNRWEDYERRSAASLAALCAAEAIRPFPYDWAFLLSDRCETDTVSDDNMLNNYKLISHLPFILHTESRLEENLRKYALDTDKLLFITAGMARLEKPDADIAWAVFRHIYEFWLRTLQETAETPVMISTEKLLSLIAVTPATDVSAEETITRDIISVAARPVKIKQLRNRTLREAEAQLYGEGAARFFAANYGAERFFNMDTAVYVVAEYLAKQSAGPYADVSYEGKTEEALRSLEAQITQYENEIAMRYQSAVHGSIFSNSIETVKHGITDVYILRYKMERIRATAAAVRAVLGGVTLYGRRREALRQALERASEGLAGESDPGRHIAEYYKRVTEDILNELTERYGPGFILREQFIGPASLAQSAEGEPDMALLTEKVAAFTRQYIMPHEHMRLSFDEDLKQRSQMSPEAYDGDFTHIDEFYRRILTEMDRQAVLAISLQRYDDLLREKYYFGESDGTLMRYVRQRENTGGLSGETAYFLEDTSGFKVVRLAGGFTAENLTRYRVMRDCYEKVNT